MNSIEAVKKKIKVLQEQADEAKDRAERLQKKVEEEKRSKEEVHIPTPHLYACTGGEGDYVLLRFCQILGSSVLSRCVG